MDKILKIHKNKLFDTLKNSNFDINLFDYSESIDNSGFKYFVLLLKNTKFKFEIKNNYQDFDQFVHSFTKFASDYPTIKPISHWLNIDDICSYLQIWLNNDIQTYFNELNEIDLWEQLKSSDKILDVNLINFDSKVNFNFDEQKQIELAINDLKLLIGKNFTLLDDEVKAVNDRLDYLADASKRLNKYDWQGLFLNTAINISVALSLNNEQGKQLFALFKQAFSMITNYFLGN